jgi:hypothetical protein
LEGKYCVLAYLKVYQWALGRASAKKIVFVPLNVLKLILISDACKHISYVADAIMYPSQKEVIVFISPITQNNNQRVDKGTFDKIIKLLHHLLEIQLI